ncbi:MAG: CvpA family protein [Alphaproteobacteria bacterium]|nr:CvpA family protein [Alphaproteobacteria bacterium]
MILDIAVGVVLLISALIAFVRGFIREVLTILGVVGGASAAYLGGPMLKPFMAGWLGVQETVAEGQKVEKFLDIVPYPILADVLSYGAIFLVVVIALSLASHFLAESARAIGLGAVDRTLGFVFGLIRGAIVLGLLYLPFHFALDEKRRDEWFADSKTHIYLEQMTQAMAVLIPAETFQKAEGAADEAAKAGAREALERIDLLKTAPGDVKASDMSSEPQNGQGYKPEIREKLDQIFEQAVPPQAATPEEKKSTQENKSQ